MKSKAILLGIMWLLVSANANALRTNPAIIEVGDKISFSIPVTNSSNLSDLQNVRISASNPPAWLSLLGSSLLGPITLPPGESMTYRLDFEVVSAPASSAEVTAEIQTDTTDLYALRYVWHFKTSNSFLTFRSECLDEEGSSFGGTLSSDKYPPDTTYQFDAHSYIDPAGKIFISAATAITLEGIDAFMEDAVTSEVASTGYLINPNPAPTQFPQLTPFTNALTLPQGNHNIVYASVDNAGNAELFKTLGLTVDGAAPGSPINLKAEGMPGVSPWKNVKEYNLSWTSPSDISGVAGARVKFGGLAPGSNSEGVFFTTVQDLLDYPTPDIANGQNVIWVWLEDNVGNANPENRVQLTLRYDGIAPVSIASTPEFSKTPTVTVTFAASDAGVLDLTGSGVKQVVLWCRNNGGPWASGGYVSANANGTFNFNTQGTEGLWEFYTQAFDNAGNSEPAPDSSTPAKARTFVDVSAPIISGIKATAFSPDTAFVEWTTDDETTAVIDYGRTTALGSQFTETSSGKTHSITLTGLPNPADIYYKITSANKTGLTAISAVNSVKTPLNITYVTDIFGVIDYTQPVTLSVTNPDVTEATFVVDGINKSGPIGPGTPLQIPIDPAITGGGTHAINVTAGSYEYTSSFVVDTAVRTVKLARLVISEGGLVSPPSGQPSAAPSAMTATTGQAAQETMVGGVNKLYLGYYAGIDPVAPAVIADLAAKAGPEAGKITLDWTAPGDDGNVGTAMKYELKYSPDPITPENFNTAVLAGAVPLPQIAATKQQAVVSGLLDGKIYYFAVKTFDELLNNSLSNIASMKTLEVAKSEAKINDQPAVTVFSAVSGVTITQVAAGSQDPAFVVARDAAAGQALAFYGDAFEISPSMSLPEGAGIHFRYADLGAEIEADLAVYKYDPAQSKWLQITSVVDAENNIIRAVTYSFSLYAVFGKDKTPPVTTAQLSGGIRFEDQAGNVYISSAARMALSAADPGASGGIERIEYRLDSSGGPFETYSAPLWLGEGWHALQYRSVDKAGNTEQAKSTFLMKDALEPRVEINFDRAFTRLPGGIIHISSTSANLDILTLDQPASGSGLKAVRFELDGAVSAIQSQHSAYLDMGRHSIRVWAEDNVGNITESKTAVVVGDLLPPIIKAPSGNFAAVQSTISFNWQHQTTTFFSLTEYDLMIGAEPGFGTPLFTHTVSSKVAVSLSFNEAGVSIEGLELCPVQFNLKHFFA